MLGILAFGNWILGRRGESSIDVQATIEPAYLNEWSCGLKVLLHLIYMAVAFGKNGVPLALDMGLFAPIHL